MVDRTALVIARYGVRNKLGRFRQTPAGVVALVGLVAGISWLLLSPGSPNGALGLGEALAAGEVAFVRRRLTETVLAGFVTLTILTSMTWVSGENNATDYEQGFLTKTPAVNVALASTLERMSVLVVGLAPILLVGCLGFGVAAGRPLAGLPMVVSLLVLYVVALLVGMPLGMAGQTLVSRSERANTLNSVLVLVASGISGATVAFSGDIGAVLARTPVRYVAAVPLAVVLPTTTSTVEAVVGAALLVLASGAALAATVRVADVFYRSEPLAPDDEDEDTPADTRLPGSVLSPPLSPRQATLVGVNWTRAARSPQMLLRAGTFLMIGALAAWGTVSGGAGNGRLPVTLVVLGALYGGQFVTLNALTDEGARMNLWGSTPVAPRDLYLAKVLTIGMPMLVLFGGGAVLTAAVVASYPAVAIAALAVFGPLAILGSSAISAGLGFTWLHGEVAGQDQDMAFPSYLPSAVHGALVIVATSPGTVAVLVLAGVLEASVSSGMALGLLAASLLATVALAAALYRSAMRKMAARHYATRL
jgi:ABC-2 type transport system permease protein